VGLRLRARRLATTATHSIHGGAQLVAARCESPEAPPLSPSLLRGRSAAATSYCSTSSYTSRATSFAPPWGCGGGARSSGARPEAAVATASGKLARPRDGAASRRLVRSLVRVKTAPRRAVSKPHGNRPCAMVYLRRAARRTRAERLARVDCAHGCGRSFDLAPLLVLIPGDPPEPSGDPRSRTSVAPGSRSGHSKLFCGV